MEEYQEYSLRGRVFQKLRDNILNGKYKEHEELREITLGDELGVSRTPVREALHQLELEGLVKIVPNKGAYVTGITGKDVKDIYMIRSLLEGLCTRWATQFITSAQIDELEETILLAEFHSQKDGSNHVAELDGKFHKILYEASNSRILEHVLTDFHKYIQLSRRFSVKEEERANKSISEHKEILAAIKEGNSQLAEELANDHVINVMKNLQKQGYKKIEEDTRR